MGRRVIRHCQTWLVISKESYGCSNSTGGTAVNQSVALSSMVASEPSLLTTHSPAANTSMGMFHLLMCTTVVAYNITYHLSLNMYILGRASVYNVPQASLVSGGGHDQVPPVSRIDSGRRRDTSVAALQVISKIGIMMTRCPTPTHLLYRSIMCCKSV